MGTPREITHGFEAKQKILNGLTELVDAVASTLGPHGHTVILDYGANTAKVTKDGVSVAKFIDSSDKYKRIGMNFVKEVATRVESEAGDGTTTASIVTKNMFVKAHEAAKKGFDVKLLRKGMESAASTAISYLEQHAQTICGIDDIRKIAKVSSNGNEEIYENVTEAFNLIGDGGMVTTAVSGKDKSYVEFNDGISYDNGFAHGNFVNSRSNTAVIENAAVLLFNDALNTWNEEWDYTISWLASDATRKLLVLGTSFSDEFKADCFTAMENSRLDKGQLILAFGPGAEFTRIHMIERFDDLAAMLNIKVSTAEKYKADILPNLNPVIAQATLKARNTVIKLNEKYTSEEVVEKRLASVRAYLEDVETNSVADPDTVALIRQRIAEMTGGVATIYVAALTRPALEEKWDSYEDTVNAVKSAIKTGYLPGGGTALFKASEYLKNNCAWQDNSAMAGWYVVADSLAEPFKMLVLSDCSLEHYAEVAQYVLEGDFTRGYDLNAHELCEDITKEVIDPVSVEVGAIKYAAASAGNFVSADYIITNEVDNVRVNSNDEVLNQFN